MNNKAFTISLALAGMAVFMIYSYITSQEQSLKEKYGIETTVLIAKKNIAEMAEITDNSLTTDKKPQSFVEPGADKIKVQDVVGLIAMVPINKGEQITLNKLMQPGIATGLSRQISPGKRAVALPVDDNSAVGRLLKPGDRIDLMTTIDPPGGAKGSQMSKIVAQDLPVLAVGEYITTTAPRREEIDFTTGKKLIRNLNVEHNYNTITLEVDPQTAMSLALLRDGGSRISVMLRNSDDSERVNIPAITLLDVLGPDQSKIMRGAFGAEMKMARKPTLASLPGPILAVLAGTVMLCLSAGIATAAVKAAAKSTSERAATKQEVLLVAGIQQTLDLNFEPCAVTAECVRVANKALMEIQVPVNNKRQLIFTPIKNGETSVTVRDEKGDIRLILKVIVASLNLKRRADELKELLQDIEGITIKIMADKIVIDGEVVVITDLNRLYAVLSDPSYKDLILNLVA